MIEKLLPYIPTAAEIPLQELINKYHFNLKIVNGRKTKRGDFRATKPVATISVNNNLSKEQFLITLVHEIAHLKVYLSTPQAKAHGTEWQQSFQQLMLPFLSDAIFENDILMPLAKHLIKPKATTDSDPILSTRLQLKNKNLDTDKYFIFDLKPGTLFELNSKTFKLLNRRRTRYECVEIHSQKKFLISGSATVKIVSL